MHSSPELLEASIVALVFGLGLRGRSRDVQLIVCRPQLLIRVLVALEILLPLLVMSVLSTLRMPSPVVIGATLIAISPGTSLVPQGELRAGRSELVFTASVIGAILSIVTVPIWLAVIGDYLIPDASIEPGAVTRLVSILFLLPLAIGIALRRTAPTLMTKASGPVILVADTLLLVVMASVLSEVGPALLHLGPGLFAILAALSACTLLIGHVAGGPNEPDRSALALMAGARHPGLALLIARYNFEGDLVVAAVVAAFLAGTLMSLPYAYWRRQRHLARETQLSVSPAEGAVLQTTKLSN